jgi:ubiquinone/menaquinone biosynthesis C-methylase UbiE
MMNWYDRHILPWAVDFACSLPAMGRQRQKVVPLACGRVLEVGFGSGLNLPFYDPGRVQQITGLDPALGAHPRARRRIARSTLAVELVGLSAEQIPRPRASFDTVVVTYSLCSIVEPLAALREMNRVLVPGGQLLFCEHGRAPDASVRRWQAWLQPLWGPLSGGCHLGRDIPALLGSAGFVCPDLGSGYLPGPRPFNYHYWGRAQATASGGPYR